MHGGRQWGLRQPGGRLHAIARCKTQCGVRMHAHVTGSISPSAACGGRRWGGAASAAVPRHVGVRHLADVVQASSRLQTLYRACRCKLGDGMRVAAHELAARIEPVAGPDVRVSHWRCRAMSSSATLRTCTLQRSCADRFLPEATATPRSTGQGSAGPEACTLHLVLGRPSVCRLSGGASSGRFVRVGVQSTKRRGQLISRLKCTARAGGGLPAAVAPGRCR